MSSIEKNEIIYYLLSRFENREIYLANYIIFLYKDTEENYFKETKKERLGLRGQLRNLQSLNELPVLLKKWLNQLNILQLRVLKNNKYDRGDDFIDLKKLKEIKDNERLFKIVDKINHINTMLDPFNYKYNLDEMKLNDILNIQKILFLGEEKNSVIKRLENTYQTLLSCRKNLNKQIENESFIDWFSDYYTKKNTYPLCTISDSTMTTKELVRLYFDALYFEDNHQYEKEVDTVKKAWQQKKFRDQGKIKKAYHLPLTKQAKYELSRLAEFNNLNENAMLEKLINKAYFSDMCDENGKDLY